VFPEHRAFMQCLPTDHGNPVARDGCADSQRRYNLGHANRRHPVVTPDRLLPLLHNQAVTSRSNYRAPMSRIYELEDNPRPGRGHTCDSA
jgi:hypothetical protein